MDPTNRLEEYMAELTRASRGVSSDEIALEVAEVREHVALLIDKNRIAGLSESDAVNAAIAQFGRAAVVGSKLRGSWLRANPLERGHFLLGLACCFVLQCALVGAFLAITSGIDFERRSNLWLLAYAGVTQLLQTVVDFAIGWLVVVVSPKRATVAVSLIFSAFALVTIALMYTKTALHSGHANWPVILFEKVTTATIPVFGAILSQRRLIRRARRLA